MVLSHVEVRVCDSIIELKSPALFSHRAVISGEQVSVETCEPGGWIQTSDRGELHGAVLRPLGRTDDLIKVGGEGVNMHELSVLMRDLRAESALPGDAALDAAPDDRLGAKVVLRTTDSALGEELRTQFNKLVLPFARIREVITVDKIVRTPLGKVVRS